MAKRALNNLVSSQANISSPANISFQKTSTQTNQSHKHQSPAPEPGPIDTCKLTQPFRFIERL